MKGLRLVKLNVLTEGEANHECKVYREYVYTPTNFLILSQEAAVRTVSCVPFQIFDALKA